MRENESALDEPVLADNYPVFYGYLYVADGRVIASDVMGDVCNLKTATGAKEIRRCDIAGRELQPIYRAISKNHYTGDIC